MLHIVNGDTVADLMKRGGMPGDVLVWRELLTEGPVSRDAFTAEMIGRRAAYMEKQFGVPAALFREHSIRQHETLADFRRYRDVVLWFEHDLFDQTMLLYLLHWFAAAGREAGFGATRLHLLCIGEFPGTERFTGLGALTAEQLMSLQGTWHMVSEAELELGASAWHAYASADPTELLRLLDGDLTALPHLREALQFHLSLFPGLGNGLNVVEQTVLELLERGGVPLDELFVQTGNIHSLYGMGDLQFWGYLDRMRSGPLPLLAIDGSPGLPKYDTPPAALGEIRVRLTERGADALAGRADAAALNGMDRWLGGVRLIGHEPMWRYDRGSKTFIDTR